MSAPDNRPVIPRRTRLLAALFACVLLPHPAPAAETVYVIDKLLVGVHEQKNLDSAIVKVLPTGTALEVLERDGELARVRDPEDVTGWVDAAYLMDEAPAAIQVNALMAEKSALEERLGKLQAAASGDGSGVLGAEIEAMTRENTELKGKLSDERLRAGQLQSEVAELRSEIQENTTPPDARIVELQREREELEQALDDARGEITDLSARASMNASSAMVSVVLREYAWIVFALVLVLAGGGFAAGVYVVDLMNRRRHGGFRV